MTNRVINYKEYVISAEEGEENGIFFRTPLQKVFFDAYYGEPISAWKYLNDIKNPIRRLYEILIGNGDIVKNIQKWSANINWGGFDGHIICSPIYFKRKYRKLTAHSCTNNNISKIKSYGYEGKFNAVAGACHVEKTVIHLSNGKTIKLKRKGKYYFTYTHIVEEIIDTGAVQS